MARDKTLWATNFMELNDKTEMQYGHVEFTRLALKAALAEIDKHLIPGHPRAELDYDRAGKLIAEQFRKSFEGPTGSEPLYVFSFAEACNEDQERRGILTLWDRYTKFEGYCVQFDRSEVLDLLSREAMRRNYALLDLATVHYGIDEKAEEFLELCFQLEQLLLAQVTPAKPGLGLQPQYDRLWPFQTTFAHRNICRMPTSLWLNRVRGVPFGPRSRRVRARSRSTDLAYVITSQSRLRPVG